MKTLQLSLKRVWFDMILSGEKKEEYREIKDYWSNRFILDFFPTNNNWNERRLPAFKSYDVILFRNGYSKKSRSMLVELKSFSIGTGKEQWGAIKDEKYFVLELGKVLSDDLH